MMQLKDNLFFLATILYLNTFAQTNKLPIDSSVFNKWPSVSSSAAISNNGKYTAYSIENEPVGGSTLVIKSTDAKWQMKILDGSNFAFSQDSKYVIFNKHGDTLGITTLGSDKIVYTPQIRSYQFPKSGTGEWLAYQLADSQSSCVLRNLRTGKEQKYEEVNGYWFNQDGSALVLQKEDVIDNVKAYSLLWVKPGKEKPQTIWSGTAAGINIQDITFDKKGTQLAFVLAKQNDVSNSTTSKSIWYYASGNARSVQLLTDSSAGIDPNLQLDAISTGFSDDGTQLFFNLAERPKALPAQNDKKVPLNIWSYKDVKLKPQPSDKLFELQKYLAVADISSKQVIQLEHDHDQCLILKKDVALFWHKEDRTVLNEGLRTDTVFFTISLRDGKKTVIKDMKTMWYNDLPTDKFFVYYNPSVANYFSYQIASGISRNITGNINTKWTGVYTNDLPFSYKFERGIAGIAKDASFLLIYDAYDIWKIDLYGRKPPINLTNGFGRKNKIIFYLPEKLSADKLIDPSKKIILTAFNLNNKDNGFYCLNMNRNEDPHPLTMGPWVFEVTRNPYMDGLTSMKMDFSPLKANHADMYLVRRMSATTSPNYFSTKDFKTFTPLSHVAPEKAYNWYTTELHTWQSLAGRPLQGILFKPENFDSTKKYPVIFRYYERLSDGLNVYIKPEFLQGACNLSITEYISNGYLVFVPDIYYRLGDPMQGTYDAVVSAVNYLSTLPFVDARRLGAEGCSFGGFESNYLATHTNLFAAVCSASGIADLVSNYGMRVGDSGPYQDFYENGQIRMGKSLWDIPDQYIKNSAIFSANKVKTPLLLMHTTNDGICLMPSIWEFFTGLRHLGKKAWMLEYTEGNHGVSGIAAKDFSIRMRQFFDHYLKDKPAPQWMTDDVDARLEKGVNDGLQPDTIGGKP